MLSKLKNVMNTPLCLQITKKKRIKGFKSSTIHKVRRETFKGCAHFT